MNQKFHYQTHNSPPSVHILSQTNPFHASLSHSLKIRFKIILPPITTSCNWSLSIRSSHQNPARTCYMPRPSNSSRLYHSNNIVMREEKSTVCCADVYRKWTVLMHTTTSSLVNFEPSRKWLCEISFVLIHCMQVNMSLIAWNWLIVLKL